MAYILLSVKKKAYVCKSIAIEMGGVSRYFSKVSGSGVDSRYFSKVSESGVDSTLLNRRTTLRSVLHVKEFERQAILGPHLRAPALKNREFQ